MNGFLISNEDGDSSNDESYEDDGDDCEFAGDNNINEEDQNDPDYKPSYDEERDAALDYYARHLSKSNARKVVM